MGNVDFSTTVDGQPVVIEQITRADVQESSERLKGISDAIADANDGNK